MFSFLDASAIDVRTEYEICDSVLLPGRPEQRRLIPHRYLDTMTGRWLLEKYAHDSCLWKHQSLALEQIDLERNVVVTTGTASGKSLIFQAATFDLIEREPDARIIVLYPLVALANDQLLGWKRAAEEIGFGASCVAEIHGSVPQDARFAALHDARVLLMTPDVCQAWLMRKIAQPELQNFLTNVRMVVIDEAHVFEGVFGSNTALLLRRLQCARSALATKAQAMRFIAASATVADACHHMRRLCGGDFVEVGTGDDGSPAFERKLLHIGSEDARKAALSVLGDFLDASDSGTFVAFADSRQGVERMVHELDCDGVRPYRAGYEHEDRRAIEDALRAGELRGVISTSALELGVNIPHFTFGLNLGVPASRKSLRQRVGRVGRSAPGAFCIVADRLAFARYGRTLQEYWDGSVEPSSLYLENRFIQFAQARCLVNELEFVGAKITLPDGDWPEGFASVFSNALPGAARNTEFDNINLLGADDPHLNYPLRDVGEARLKMIRANDNNGVEEISLRQAIHEAYPGATYFHQARPFRVVEWRMSSFDKLIKVVPSNDPAPTRPISKVYVNAAIDSAGVVAGHVKHDSEGVIAECSLQITERIEGYIRHNKRHLYKEERLRNPGMATRIRDFRTTGVLIQFSHSHFKEHKRHFALLLKQLMQREYSISAQDVDVAASHVAVVNGSTPQLISDAIVVFDSTYGSLRLTEPCFTELGSLLNLMRRANELTTTDGEVISVPIDVIDAISLWSEQLASSQAPEMAMLAARPDGFIRVLAAGSRVSRPGFNSGIAVEAEIVAPMLMPGDNGMELCYRCKDIAKGKELILLSTAISAFHDQSEQLWWNPETDEIVADLDDEPVAASSTLDNF
jgi:DEAD/DEAH box helicase domain-containing protein